MPWPRSLSEPGRRLLQPWRRLRHNHKLRRLYAQFIQPGDLVFDVGANVGSQTQVFLQLGARVIAVEPLKEYVRTLFIRFHDNPRVQIIPKALGVVEGQREMMIAQPHQQVSSLSKAFTQAFAQRVAQVGFFKGLKWEETRMVGITTMDRLIDQFGLPEFVNLDVEGYEYEVLRGLTHPIPALSLKFCTFLLEPALQSIDYLQRFGGMRLNYGIEERPELMLKQWVDVKELVQILESCRDTPDFLSGDVYMCFKD